MLCENNLEHLTLFTVLSNIKEPIQPSKKPKLQPSDMKVSINSIYWAGTVLFNRTSIVFLFNQTVVITLKALLTVNRKKLG